MSTALERAAASCDAALERAREAMAVEVVTASRRMKFRNFRGAERSRLYNDWWASLLSPQDEIRGDLKTLRARGRELARNNAYAGQYLELLKTNIVGPNGPRLRAKNLRRGSRDLDTAANETIEGAFADFWSGPVTTDGTMSGVEFDELLLETTAREGEVFVQRVVSREFRHGVAFRIIDNDLVDDGYSIQGGGNAADVFMGIEVDGYGRRLAYHVLDYPYGPGFRGRGRVRVPAREVLHAFRAMRANQMRGVIWMARAMAALHHLERYIQNEQVASAAGAGHMGFIQNEGSTFGGTSKDAVTEGAAASGSDGVATNRLRTESEPGMIWELEPGQTFNSWKPDHPSTAFGSFVSAILHEVSTACGVSYEALTSDYSKVTYLSGRLAQIVEKLARTRDQQWFFRSIQQPLYEWWLESAFLSGAIDLPGDWQAYRAAKWTGPRFPFIDPSKDWESWRSALEIDLTSPSRVLAESGYEGDLEDLCREIQRDREIGARFGIDFSVKPRTAGSPAMGGAAGGAAGPADDPESADDDAGEGDEEPIE